ncbi:MAG: glycosyltransferase family 39 protein [Planctomycetes bacterium]|nr:glycosyltransferase family 39 protein [Planctomycetota bacterium]MCC7170738.1 glycosyltransferase family 39 protein [Planctomycetota bacterium]
MADDRTATSRTFCASRRWTRFERVVVLIALVCGAWLRVPTDACFTHWDEGAYVAGPQGIGPFAREEPLAVYAPPMVPYALEIARRAIGIEPGERSDPRPGAVIVVIAGFGIASIAAAAWLARALAGSVAGMVAAWCLALSPLSIAYSRMALTDVPFTAFLLASLAALVVAQRRGSVRYAVLGGVLAGMSTLTKYHGFLAIAGLLLALAATWMPWTRGAARIDARKRFALVLAAGLAYTPFFVGALLFVAHDMGFEAFRATRATWTVGLHPWTVRQAATFFVETVLAFDLPVVAVAAGFGSFALRRRRGVGVVIATSVVLALILIAYRNYTRLFVPAVGLCAVFAACGVASIVRNVAARRRAAVLAGLLVVLLVPWRTSPLAAAAFRSDAYERMAELVEARLGADDGVVVLVGQYALVPYLSREAAARVIAINEPEGRRRLAAGDCAWIVFDEDPARRPEVESAWKALSARARLLATLPNPLPPAIEFDRTRGKALSAFDRELRLYRVESIQSGR